MNHTFLLDRFKNLIHVIDETARATIEKDAVDAYMKTQGFDAQLAFERAKDDLAKQADAPAAAELAATSSAELDAMIDLKVRERAPAAAAELAATSTAELDAMIDRKVRERLAAMH
jgi:hypothetical protein